MVTVFTPIYNRKYIIEQLYKSLLNQTSQKFEWIVIDDGSTDGVYDLLEVWQKENKIFPMIIQRVENGGKHRAINKAVKMASGEAFFIVDSDDYLPNDAVEFIENHFKEVNEDDSFAGISGLRYRIKIDTNIGDTLNFQDYVDATNLEREQYGLLGDKAEVYKTEVLKKYPFPEYANEKFVTEEVVWNRIAADGLKIRWFNKKLYYCEYLPDGLSSKVSKIFEESPQGWAKWLSDGEKYSYWDEKTIRERARDFFNYAYYRNDFEYLNTSFFKGLYFCSEEFDKGIEKFTILKSYIEKNNIDSISIYGYGVYGKKLEKMLNKLGIKISYLIDAKADASNAKIYRPYEKLPSVDSICISLRNDRLTDDVIEHLKQASDDVWYFVDVVPGV